MSLQRIHSLMPVQKTPAVRSVNGGSQEQPGRLVFKQILDQAASNLSDGRIGTWPSLSKQELSEIVNAVQTQMTAHLIRAMSAEAREDMGMRLPFTPDRFILPDGEPSRPLPAKQVHDSPKGHDDLESIIRTAADACGVDPALIKSVIKVESNFNPNSTSPKGAMGLMQLMPGTARELGVQNAYDPAENIQAGTRYLGMLLNRYEGDISMALAAYNWGMGNIERRPAQMPLETKNYIENVTRRYERAKA